MEECLDLVKKWEEEKMHCNMVHVEPHKNKKVRKSMFGC
jgi:hypothetical protein